jgi:hypothetical protein
MTFTLELLKPIADTMTWDTAIFLGGALVSIENASPLLLSWAYQAAKIHMRLVGKYGEQTLWSLAQMKTKLALMARRWKAGGKCTSVLLRVCHWMWTNMMQKLI